MIKRMKNAVPIIFIAYLLGLVQSTADMEEFSAAEQHCLAANNISKDDLAEFLNKVMQDKRDNIGAEYKCYIHCVADAINALDYDGLVDVDLVDSSEELTTSQRNMVADCKNLHDGEGEPCEYAYNMMICIMDKMKDEKPESE